MTKAQHFSCRFPPYVCARTSALWNRKQIPH